MGEQILDIGPLDIGPETIELTQAALDALKRQETWHTKQAARQAVASNNYNVGRTRQAEQINRVIKQLANKSLNPRKRGQLEKRLKKLQKGGGQ